MSLALWTVLMSASFAADDVPLVTVLAGTTQAPVVDGASLKLRVPFSCQPLPTGTHLQARVVSVAHGGETGGAGPFSVGMDLPDGAVIGALTVEVDETRPLRPGDYALRIELSLPPPKAGEPPGSQVVEVQVSIPEATLVVPTSLMVEQRCPLWGACDAPELHIPLREGSGNSRLTGIQVLQGDPAALGTVLVAGQVGGAVTPADLAPGGAATLTPSIPAFPFGHTRATLSLRAPELAAPVDVPIEVVTRPYAWVLAGALACGALVGFLQRTGFPVMARLSAAKGKADEVRAALARQRNHPDAMVGDEVARAMEALDAACARGRWRPDVILAATSEAVAVLSRALEDLEARKGEARSAIDRLASQLSSRWVLTLELAQKIEAARAGLAAARARLSANDAQGAMASASSARQALDEARLDALALAKRLAAAFSTPGADRAPRTPSYDPKGYYDAAVTAAAAEPFTAADADASAVLGALHSLLASARDWVEATAGAFAATRPELAKMGVTFDDPALPLPPTTPIDEAVTALAEASNRLYGQVTAAKMYTDRVAGDPTIGGLADEGRYLAVVNKVNVDLLHMGEEPEAEQAQERAGTPAAVPSPAVEEVREATAPAAAVVDIDVDRYEGLYSFILRNFLSTAIAFITLIFFGYGAFADSFFGTWTDLFSVFVWAYGTDLGIDAVVNKIAGKTSGS